MEYLGSSRGQLSYFALNQTRGQFEVFPNGAFRARKDRDDASKVLIDIYLLRSVPFADQAFQTEHSSKGRAVT
jgi:hypothetical protein